ncbi:hypothetical protein LMG31887_46310 (plasmid) [Xanthomonas hydrangeae]|nr:hypothetical protein LMG31887_46310 [Xanthomonas hydrangeae]CAD7747921.1 hypothetical protein LMG31887_46310 [Xanthomonas hydrangeae]CAD7748202.1 hypothetical protein LMG31885_45180 [Xanthomonas hydrangeae]CAD7748203.1 hypothetical protein LMG31885_45180 [Xanthomonas hydrangeae]
MQPHRDRRGFLRRRYWFVLGWMYRCLWMVAGLVFIASELKAIGLALAWVLSFWIEQISNAFPSLLTDFADAAIMFLIGMWLKGQFEASACRCEVLALDKATSESTDNRSKQDI